ncbi:hypothetical protein GCM10010371_57430 [Streptomyces subrutilus]|uniref:Uncharacterized protein n=1 Tax=Streptomyces subrutilus TaxID=36818 RepID=A0A918RAV0_9ACTN|nr:hypothetical protein [Streptomyces subrutilus]GGZ90017.1 hypothetical protein GCM10010371_57430 [Streptomyces subrutilus]
MPKFTAVFAGPAPILPGAKPTPIPGMSPIVSELFGYALWVLVIAGGCAVGYGVFKLASADKSRSSGGASEPFKWMGGGVLAIMISSVLISVLNGIAA